MRSDQQSNSRYARGGQTTVEGDTIKWWERTIFKKSPTDITYILTRKHSRRPDLLAYELYGKSSLQWFVLQYANISDVNVEFVDGVEIVLPTRARLFGELLTQNPSTQK